MPVQDRPEMAVPHSRYARRSRSRRPADAGNPEGPPESRSRGFRGCPQEEAPRAGSRPSACRRPEAAAC